jgi:hypothetical protein
VEASVDPFPSTLISRSHPRNSPVMEGNRHGCIMTRARAESGRTMVRLTTAAQFNGCGGPCLQRPDGVTDTPPSGLTIKHRGWVQGSMAASDLTSMIGGRVTLLRTWLAAESGRTG